MERSKEKGNVVEFPIASSEYENAALWLARLDRGLSTEHQEELTSWLGESPGNANALFELAAFWDELDLLSELSGLFPLDRRPVRRRPQRAPWGLVATFAGVIGLGLYAFLAEPFRETPATVVFDERFSTAVGERVTKSLPDGSSIILNTNTEIQVRYQERDRFVELRRGEAHFAVAHNPGRPFGVRVGNHIVQAVGTAFNVRIQNTGEIEVTVTDGIVQILDDARGVDVDAAASAGAPRAGEWWTSSIIGTGLVQGQIALLDASLREHMRAPEVRRLEQVDLEMKLAWQSGFLVFEGESLKTVVDEIARYTTTEFVIIGEELDAISIGGIFETGDIDGALQSLKDNFGIRAEWVTDDRIMLLPDE